MNKRLAADRRLDDATVDWMNQNPCMYGGDLHVEARQAREEGRDLTGGLDRALDRHKAFRLYPGTGKFDSYQPMNKAWWRKAFNLLDEVQKRPLLKGYPHREPTSQEAILKARPRPTAKVPAWKGSLAQFEDQVHAAFLGRLVGSHFGAPLEGWYRNNLRIYSEETGAYPPVDYFRSPTATEFRRIRKRGATQWFEPATKNPLLRGNIRFSCENDDINFTIVNWKVVEHHGAGFTPVQVGRFWASFFGDGCSAEGVALRNLEAGIAPPFSASFRNPYREWIGAQIRGDYFGYANPGDPARAAEWAWRDGVVTHVRNGVYGEMWIAAAIAAAFTLDRPEPVILAGLDQVPAGSRLTKTLHRVLDLHRQGLPFERFMDDMHARLDQHDYQDWCHVIANAEICAAALLWGNGDFDKTMAYSVLPGFDTDCNGATVGSIIGLWHGVKGIPSHWTRPFNGQFRLGFGCGFGTMESIEQTAAGMAATAWKNRAAASGQKAERPNKIHLV